MFKILDCTLRDGGYINNWEFGYENIKNYLDCMTDSDADYIEAGFLVDKAVNQNQSLYNKTEDVPIASDKITLMIAYGKYNVVSLPESSISSVKNMRYIFKHKEISHALYEVSVLKQKGYKLFINPTFISVYDNKEILNLIKKVNEIMPFCFTIVDSMGVLNKTRFVSIFNMVNDCLNPDISIGIHLHNNLNYINENINALSDIKTDRQIILDTTLSGIGRGAGNPVLENYIQINKKAALYLKNAIDKFSSTDKQKYKFAALNNCHPCYASYLIRNNVPNDKINSVFQSIPPEFKTDYNKPVIEKIVKKLN